MNDKNYQMYDGSLYSYTVGSYCGVLVKNEVMRKLVKLQSEHLEKVKRLLMDEADKGNVFPDMWALHYPEGKQTTVRYIDTSAILEDRIKNATVAASPKHCPLVFIAESMEEAAEMADNRIKELSQ